MTAPRENVPALLFATMFPQAAVLMMSLAPPVMAEEVTRSFGLKPELAGLYVGIVYGGVFVGNLFCAELIRRFGPLRLSLVCVVGTALGLVLFACGGRLGLLAGAIVMGLAYGPLTPASAQAISHHAGSPAFGFIVSLRQTSVPMGGVLAGLLVPPLLLRLGWVETCLVLAGGSTLATVLFGALSPTVRRERPPVALGRRIGLLQPIRLVFGSGPLFRLSCASMIFGAVQLIATSSLVVYLVSGVGYDLVTAGAALSVSQISGILGRPLWGHLADKIAAPRLLLAALGAGMAISCFGLAALGGGGPSWATIPLAILFGATAVGWNGVFLAQLIREVEPGAAAVATSGGLLFCYFGICVGPPLFSGVATAAGFATALVLAGLLAAGGGLLLLPGARSRGAARD